MSNAATTNTSIPITKMVNDLFLQWLSLPDTRSTLYTALRSVQTNSKMPEPINYPKVRVYSSWHLHRIELAKQCHWDRWIFSVKRRWRDISLDDFYQRLPIDWNCSRCSLDLYNTWRWILQTTTFRFTSCFPRSSSSVQSTQWPVEHPIHRRLDTRSEWQRWRFETTCIEKETYCGERYNTNHPIEQSRSTRSKLLFSSSFASAFRSCFVSRGIHSYGKRKKNA